MRYTFASQATILNQVKGNENGLKKRLLVGLDPV